MINNGRESGDFGYKTGIRDLNNVAPRVGFAYNVGGKNDLVIRGGSGIYYNTPVSNVTYSHQYFNRSVAASLHAERPGLHGEPDPRRHRGGLSLGRVSPTPVQPAHHRLRLRRSLQLAELDRIPEAARLGDGRSTST